jgi:hypothetical protein
MGLKFDHIKAAIAAPTTKHQHEFQEVCEQLEPIYGKVIWTLPHLPGVNEHKIKEAHKIAVKRGITRYGYLKGIIKKLP